MFGVSDAKGNKIQSLCRLYLHSSLVLNEIMRRNCLNRDLCVSNRMKARA